MIKLFTTIFASVLTATLSFAQQIKYSDLATLSKRGGEYTSYIASDGAEYKVGDKIKIGYPSSNAFVYVMYGSGLAGVTPLPANNAGIETEIKEIAVAGTNKIGFRVTLITSGFGMGTKLYIDTENALATGEVKGFGMTSDEALAELKKAKDKLDLGLISQEEYEKIRAELSQYIK